MGDLFSSAEPDDRARHGVRPVEEEEWLQIRSLAMSCYFQAIVSKVHCLGEFLPRSAKLTCVRGHPGGIAAVSLGVAG
jgi:hypothetical protein